MVDFNKELMLKGHICPYCNEKTELIDSKEIYGTSYGMIYICKPCDAYVGCHKGTNKSLGRVADSELRQWKQSAHSYFDPLWKKKITLVNCSKSHARNLAYKWLSEKMKINVHFCHIGMFDIEQCKKVVEICKPYLPKHFAH